jgi:hypothetical protein
VDGIDVMIIVNNRCKDPLAQEQSKMSGVTMLTNGSGSATFSIYVVGFLTLRAVGCLHLLEQAKSNTIHSKNYSGSALRRKVLMCLGFMMLLKAFAPLADNLVSIRSWT